MPSASSCPAWATTARAASRNCTTPARIPSPRTKRAAWCSACPRRRSSWVRSTRACCSTRSPARSCASVITPASEQRQCELHACWRHPQRIGGSGRRTFRDMAGCAMQLRLAKTDTLADCRCNSSAALQPLLDNPFFRITHVSVRSASSLLTTESAGVAMVRLGASSPPRQTRRDHAADCKRPHHHRAGRQIQQRRQCKAERVSQHADRIAHHEPAARRMIAAGERVNDETCEHQINADQLHRRGNHDREQRIKPHRTETGAHAEPQHQHHCGEQRDRNELRITYPQYLTHQQILEMLAAVRIVGEHLKDLLVGQILWVSYTQLIPVALLTAVVLVLWFGMRARLGPVGFYALFAIVVTASVQLVGDYLVFASLIIPALASRYHPARRRLVVGYAVGVSGCAFGLAMSALLDLPSGAVVVWTLAVCGMAAASLARWGNGAKPDDGNSG